MNIALIEFAKKGDNKDYNGGFGTTFDIYPSFKAWILKKTRLHYENFPTLIYAYISAIFKKYGHKVTYYKNKIPEDCDLALINVTAIRYKDEISALETISKSGKYKCGVFGAFATLKKELFKDADFIITGEPENAIGKIAKTGKIPSGVINSEPIKNTDNLPFPDWDIFNVKKFSYAPLLPGKPFVFMQRSRGCPYSCGYCPHIVLGKYRIRTIDNVISEMKYLKSKYNVKRVHFRDSCFYIEEKDIKNFSGKLIKKNLNIKWGIESRLDLLNKNVIDIMYDAGLRAVKVGIENASKKRLEMHGRIPPDIEHAKEIIDYCRKKGITTNACYIIGFPDENKEDIKATVKLAKWINSSYANFFILTPLPGTKFIENKHVEIIDNNWEHRDNFHLVYKHVNFNPKTMRKIQRKALTGYYFRLKWIFSHIKERFKRLFD